MICGKYLLSYGDGCDENLMTKKESATATTIITYHDYWESLSDCQFPVCSNVSEPLLPCLYNLYTIDNRYKTPPYLPVQFHISARSISRFAASNPSQALVPGCSWHVFCATRQLLEPNHGPCDRATVPPCHGSPSSESQGQEVHGNSNTWGTSLSMSQLFMCYACYAFIFTDCLEGCQKMEHLPRLHPFPLTEPFRSQPSEKWNGTQVPPKPQTSLYRTWGQKARISWCQGALGHETRVSFAEPTALLTPGGVSGEGYFRSAKPGQS